MIKEIKLIHAHFQHTTQKFPAQHTHPFTVETHTHSTTDHRITRHNSMNKMQWDTKLKQLKKKKKKRIVADYVKKNHKTDLSFIIIGKNSTAHRDFRL